MKLKLSPLTLRPAVRSAGQLFLAAALAAPVLVFAQGEAPAPVTPPAPGMTSPPAAAPAAPAADATTDAAQPWKYPCPYGGPGPMGRGYPGGRMGPGMMGPGMMGPGYGGPAAPSGDPGDATDQTATPPQWGGPYGGPGPMGMGQGYPGGRMGPGMMGPGYNAPSGPEADSGDQGSAPAQQWGGPYGGPGSMMGPGMMRGYRGGPGWSAPPSPDVEQRIQQLEQRIRELESRQN